MRENQVSILHLEAKLKILLFSVKHMKQQAVLYLRLCIVMYYDKGSDTDMLICKRRLNIVVVCNVASLPICCRVVCLCNILIS